MTQPMRMDEETPGYYAQATTQTGVAMQHGNSVIRASDDMMSNLIRNAQQRVVFMAPGVTKELADALAAALQSLGGDAVSIIVDMDPEAYRLGYGTEAGLAAIAAAAQNSALRLWREPGVRIGLLIADDTTLVFAPTPELIESANEKPNQPNAVMLGAPPAALSRDVGLGQQPDRERTVGMDAVSPAELAKVRTDLERNPPAKFDLARKVRVYQSYFQFVELELMNCYISRRKVKLPSELVGLDADPQLAKRFQAQFDLFERSVLEVPTDDGKRKITERSLSEAREEIAKSYFISLPGYGMVIAKDRKNDFDAAVKKLETDVECFKAGVEAQIVQHIEKTTQFLVDAFLPAVLNHPPQHFLKYGFHGLTGDRIKQLLADEIRAHLSKGAQVGKMTVRKVYKDIAYDAVQDESFQVAAQKAKLGLDDLFSQGTAVQAEPTQSPLSFPLDQDDESNGHS